MALVDAETCATAGGMCVSWWHAKVRAGEAPQAAFRRPRCTRWRLSEVLEFWRNFGANDDPQVAVDLVANATRASGIARAKRDASAVGG